MRILLVDDEQQVLRGVSRTIECEEDSWEIETAQSGAEALQSLTESPFDVVVTDMRMPGMDGAELLAIIESQYPKMLRVVLSGQADRETVLRAVKPMHQYLSKPCEAKKLIEVIKRAEVFQATIRSPEVLDAIGRADCLPSLPEMVPEINEQIESENGDAKSIARIVCKDPNLSARVLQLANSSIFGLRNPVLGVEQAVSIVGGDMIRSLAMSQAIFEDGKQTGYGGLSPRALFDHCFRVGLLARQLAKQQGGSTEDTNLIFSAGLLHDIGKLILLNCFPQEYKVALTAAADEHRPLADLEMQTFGATHQGVGAYLLELWGLPTAVTEAVAAHHSFEFCSIRAPSPHSFVFAANWIDSAHKVQELDARVECCEDRSRAADFADQIKQWQEAELEQVAEQVTG